MSASPGKFQTKKIQKQTGAAFLLLPLSLFLVELFAFFHLTPGLGSPLWPLAFGGLWAVGLGCILWMLPGRLSRIGYGMLYFGSVIYAGVQTGYYILFSEMMWLTDFRYASEGADYADVLLTYPAGWWAGLFCLLALGAVLVWKFPRWKRRPLGYIPAVLLAVFVAAGICRLPERVFEHDEDIRYAGSDYGRMQSAEAAYENMFNAHRLYQICGLNQTFVKDVYTHLIYPMTPAFREEQEAARQEIQASFDEKPAREENEMTGVLKGKNVILVLMESMDDWMIGAHTPTIQRLMDEGINFTSFYTPVYGGIRTFNTEFAINTGSFLSSAGGYAFDYVTNTYNQSLASQLREEGYSAKTFHYNDPTFYSRGVFSEAMGYEEYVCYGDYIAGEKDKKNLLYDDSLLFDNAGLNREFFRQGQPTLNFVITRSAHLSYKYNEVLSHWGLKKYPEYRGLTGSEEADCALLKARLVDDFFARMLAELEAQGQLENTVIIGVTDHYTYGYKNMEELLQLSGVEEKLLLEKTPCFIWSPGLEPQTVDKVLNTSDLLPTLLNLLGVESPYAYIGSDAFDNRYAGFVPFANGSWIADGMAYDASTGAFMSLGGEGELLSAGAVKEIQHQMQKFTRVNNLILDADFYKQKLPESTEPRETAAETTVESAAATEAPATLPAPGEFVRVTDYIPGIQVDLRYASEENFTGQVIYEFQEAYLRYSTVQKLLRVQQELEEMELSLKIWDAFRPVAAQYRLWEVYPDPTYVSDPQKGFSTHSRGGTLDVTVVDADGKELEMPTGFDDFTPKADRNYADCSAVQAENAALLESLMEKHGFKGYFGEWWHFSDTDEYPVEEWFRP